MVACDRPGSAMKGHWSLKGASAQLEQPTGRKFLFQDLVKCDAGTNEKPAEAGSFIKIYYAFLLSTLAF